ncbi:Secernin-3 [Blattella germanica]|nr:Secernin-3 [Blattella germanica]
MTGALARMQLVSCDTFVVLPPFTEHGGVVFGKNSDRPRGEVQELIYEPAKQHGAGDQLQCTYITIDQVEATQAVILSKPSWMWGAEMGANDCGVAIGNEAVWTRLGGDDDNEERLLGMDLVRLGLERAQTAEQAVNVITELLERYGQGGPCSDVIPDFTYHNSFLIADPKEAWVLETAGKGCRNISNALSIGTQIDRSSADLKEVAQQNGLWDGEVSLLGAVGSGKPNCHWFTATPNPRASVFKPFIFTPDARISRHTISPSFDDDPAKLHAQANENARSLLHDMELNCVAEVNKFLSDFVPGQSLAEVDDLLKDVVETEVKFYK